MGFLVIVLAATAKMKYSGVGVDIRFSRVLYNSPRATDCCLLTVGQMEVQGEAE
jgi:hypothetical protein